MSLTRMYIAPMDGDPEEPVPPPLPNQPGEPGEPTLPDRAPPDPVA